IEAREIDLIALGTHGRTGASKLLMGSVAEQIFRESPCPVLTVGPNVSAEPGSVADIHTILFPTEFSPECQSAIPFAVSLAEENQARLYLLHVEPDLVPGSMEDGLRERARAMLPQEATLQCRPKVFVESGDPAEKVLNLADELGIDLIVLGTKHVSRFAGTRTHLGMATAYKIVSGAHCPVISLRG
ncbi:MAG: universal stress protein, partial [Candidatus Acidiferrales bacterium]